MSIRNAYVRWSVRSVALTAGQFNAPFSRQYLTSITAIEPADRAAVVDALRPQRDIGVMAECAVSTLGTLALGAFNAEDAAPQPDRAGAGSILIRRGAL